MSRLTIPEILESLEDKKPKERVEILRKNETKSLKQVLYVAFHPDVEFALPDSRPENLKIEETPIGTSRNNLHRQSRKLKIFMRNMGYDGLSVAKRESIFIQILESIHSSEAELLLQICVDRKLKSSLKYQEVCEAFPRLLPEIEQEEVVSEPEPTVEVEEVVSEPEPVAEEQEVYKNVSDLYKKKMKKGKNKKSSKKS